MAKFILKKSLSLNNMTIKQQIKHGAIQKVCHLHNGIFYPIQLCHTLSILLHHFPCVIHKTYQETIEWEGKRFSAYMAASANHVISTEVENHIFKHD